MAGASPSRWPTVRTRPLGVEVVSDTGFHLGAGLYFGFDGHFHGEWRGDLVVDGERIDDCSTPDTARRLHQIRDTVIHVTDPVGGGEGWGNMQPIITGDHPASASTARRRSCDAPRPPRQKVAICFRI